MQEQKSSKSIIIKDQDTSATYTLVLVIISCLYNIDVDLNKNMETS